MSTYETIPEAVEAVRWSGSNVTEMKLFFERRWGEGNVETLITPGPKFTAWRIVHGERYVQHSVDRDRPWVVSKGGKILLGNWTDAEFFRNFREVEKISTDWEYD